MASTVLRLKRVAAGQSESPRQGNNMVKRLIRLCGGSLIHVRKSKLNEGKTSWPENWIDAR
jgi:hypothetical protein